MAEVLLVSCVKAKNPGQCKARDLYDSTKSALWRGRRGYEEERYERRGKPWHILSAKYHLLHPDRFVEYYEESLKGKPIRAKRAWAKETMGDILSQFGELAGMTFEIHAGADYRVHLTYLLTEAGARVESPLDHLRIGEQANWYEAQGC